MRSVPCLRTGWVRLQIRQRAHHYIFISTVGVGRPRATESFICGPYTNVAKMMNILQDLKLLYSTNVILFMAALWILQALSDVAIKCIIKNTTGADTNQASPLHLDELLESMINNDSAFQFWKSYQRILSMYFGLVFYLNVCF